ncbi:hypothetical protein V6Z12_D08G181700 [Gossypium hirsutum]
MGPLQNGIVLHGRISGVAIRIYLLERSRVCQVSDLERNYHCFYLLCAAPPEEIEKYKLGKSQCYHRWHLLEAMIGRGVVRLQSRHKMKCGRQDVWNTKILIGHMRILLIQKMCMEKVMMVMANQTIQVILK